VAFSAGGPNGSDLTLDLWNANHESTFSVPGLATNGTWQYIAATFVPNGSGGGTATIYLNGKTLGSSAMTVAPPSVTYTQNAIAKSDWSSNPDFKGSIQDVGVYPSVLGPTAIVNHYDVGKYDLAAGSQPGLSYGSSVESGNPTAFWKLGESSGTSAADSSSGGTNSGTYQNSPTLDTAGALTGSSDGSVTLNGTNQYVSVPSGFSMFGGSSGFTIEGWAKPTAANTWARLIDFGNGAPSDNVALSVGGVGGRDLTLCIDAGTNGTCFAATNVVTENVWQYVAATFVPNGAGGGAVTLYLNGTVVNTGTIGYAPTSVTRNDNYIGKSNWSSDHYFQGSIQDVAIYPSALSSATVLAHYDTGAYRLQPTSTYTYNGDGLRMSKLAAGSANPQQFVYNNMGSVPTVLSDGTAYYIYGADGYPLEMIQGSTVTWYHHDRLGSTRVLTDNSGTIVGTATYVPYGASSTTGTTTPLGYTGAYEDAESGLIYLVNRYYDPATGQFLSVDAALSLTHEPYSYTADNPVNQTDPTGLCVAGRNGGCAATGLQPWGTKSTPCPQNNSPSAGNPNSWLGPNLNPSYPAMMPSYCYSGLGCVCPKGTVCVGTLGWEPLYGPPVPAPTPTPASPSTGDGLSPGANNAIQGASAGIGCVAGARGAAPVAGALAETGPGALAVEGVGCALGGVLGWFGVSLDF
jgi:RHS repeat-associated protein